MVPLFLTSNSFHSLFWCFYCWLWTSTFWLKRCKQKKSKLYIRFSMVKSEKNTGYPRRNNIKVTLRNLQTSENAPFPRKLIFAVWDFFWRYNRIHHCFLEIGLREKCDWIDLHTVPMIGQFRYHVRRTEIRSNVERKKVHAEMEISVGTFCLFFLIFCNNTYYHESCCMQVGIHYVWILKKIMYLKKVFI